MNRQLFLLLLAPIVICIWTILYASLSSSIGTNFNISSKIQIQDSPVFTEPTISIGTPKSGSNNENLLLPPLPHLVQHQQSYPECNKSENDHIQTLPVQDVLQSPSNNNNNIKTDIPNVIHQTSKMRCVVPQFHSWINRWKTTFPQWAYYFHTDQAMDRLVAAVTDPTQLFNIANARKKTIIQQRTKQEQHDLLLQTFPHLNRLWKASCIVQGAMKADVWRQLLLWHYGGIYSDIDSKPNHFGPSQLQGQRAMFVLDKDLTASFHFMGLVPNHPVLYLALQLALYQLLWVADIAKVNPVAITGPAALRGGIRELLQTTTAMPNDNVGTLYVLYTPHNHTNQTTSAPRRITDMMSFLEQHHSVQPGEYQIVRQRANENGNDQMTVISSFQLLSRMDATRNENDVNYWIEREMKLFQKRKLYQQMNMSHFIDVMRGESAYTSCFQRLVQYAYGNQSSSTTSISSPFDLIQSHQETSCPSGTISIRPTNMRSASTLPTGQKIPKLIHQVVPSYCATEKTTLHSNHQSLRHGWVHLIYDQHAMNRLVQQQFSNTVALFPHLALLWQDDNFLQWNHRVLLWRLLILWEHGGVFVAPSSTSNDNSFEEHNVDIQDNDLAVMVARSNATRFLAAVPHHPLIFYALEKSLHDVMVLRYKQTLLFDNDDDRHFIDKLVTEKIQAALVHCQEALWKQKLVRKRRMAKQFPRQAREFQGTDPDSRFRLLDRDEEYWISSLIKL